MGSRLTREAGALGLSSKALADLMSAHDLAMRVRDRAVPDDHHPDYLHPGRSALVALTDGDLRDPLALAAVILFDSRRPALAPQDDLVERICGGNVLASRALLPSAELDATELLEALVTLPGPLAVAALAEALDHARHAHIGADAGARGRVLELVEAAYFPVAGRLAPKLGSRFEHWCRVFRKRFV